ncbi:DNA helicase-2 / ATP-dependent DNA helicase PcrA [Carnobacterium alterfunditum]|uniref:DNA helicase-2 / ATP-dependent DNA helicase PcrA n=1 Tax=Carnobacterium alterfunditum TaxID=28230 RepID=A0A1N6EIS2_9LACT|nr:RNA polymerase recycling motor HelD [Carnobacterium alterfunditum]SIN82881.1 DNA helicase-2 / ATP-dependent DNA helicase PcrA [Carnobacterium alterfunditum]
MKNSLSMEQQRVQTVVKQIQTELNQLKQTVANDSEIQKMRLKESGEIKINQGSSESMWESAGELRSIEQDLMIRSRTLLKNQNRVMALEKMVNDPYFGRIDYEDELGKETIYIGISSVFDEYDNLVVDWRSPIASLYYEGNVGDTISLKIGEEKLALLIELKRQFLIRQAKIIQLLDTDNIMGDPYLLEALEDRSTYQMGAVISTLQKQQNQIVRETSAKITLIEGVAGSGKTVVLMQKIAYLLYTFRDQLKASEIILFSPNKIFQTYISQVLPELGELNVTSHTFPEFMNQRVPKYTLISNQDEELSDVTLLKGSLQFSEALKDYTDRLKSNFMRFSSLSFQDEIIISKEEIKELFYSIESEGTLASKLALLQTLLLQKIAQFKQTQRTANWVEDALLSMSDSELRQYESESKNEQKAEETLIDSILETAYSPVVKRIKRLTFIRCQHQYIHFLKTVPKLLSLADFSIDDDMWTEHIQQVVTNMAHKELVLEDLDAFYSLFQLMHGPISSTKFKYICLDEVQDFSPFQLQMLKDFYPTAYFVLSGDLNQNILMKRISFNDLDAIFAGNSFQRYQLLTSYRSTNEIIQFSNRFLEENSVAEPNFREGKKPELILTTDNDHYLDYVKTKIAENQKAGFRTAFISKNYAEAERFYQELTNNGIESNLVLKDTDNSHYPVIVIPVQLAKGLEFDSVFALFHYSTPTSSNDLSTAYTICSRAMHELYFIAPDLQSPLVSRLESADYHLVDLN